MRITEQQAEELNVYQRRAERARQDIAETITEIQERLRPQALAGKAGRAAKEATVGRVTNSIRQNPIPAALVGTGIAWMFISGRRGDQSTSMSYRTPRYDPNRRSFQSQGGLSDGGAVGQAKDKASEVADEVKEKVSNVAGQVTDVAGQVGDSVGEAVDQTSTQVSEQVQRVQSSFQQMLEENPLPVALVAAGLGALIATAVPKTQAEERIVGDARDRVADQARQVGQKVGRVAERVQSSVKEEAQKESLV
jgi:hypothetical protein